MATKVASILAEIGIDSSKFTAGAGGALGSVSSLISGIGTLNPALLAMGGAFIAVAEYMGQAEKAAAASNEVNAKMEAILKATGYAANTSSAELQALAGEISNLTGIDDEAIVSAESMMLTFRNIGREEFPRAMQAAADLSTTFGGLESSSMQLGKALNDPIKGVTALGRAGVTFSDDQKAMIKSFVETNQLAKAQEIILSEVEQQVGGTAAAIAKAGDGSNRLKVSTENLSESIGKSLVPATRAWNNALADMYDSVSKSIDAQNRLAPAVDKAMEALGAQGIEKNSLFYALHRDEVDKLVQSELFANDVKAQTIKMWRDMGYQVNEATGAISLSTEKIQQNEEEMTKANEATLKGVEQWQDLEQSFSDRLDGLYSKRKDAEAEYTKLKAQGYSETSTQVQGVLDKMAETDAAIQNEKLQYDIKTKAVVLGYIEQKMAADGNLDDKETLWLLQKGVEWGVYKQSAIDAYRTASAEAANYAAQQSAIERNVTVTVTTLYTGATSVSGNENVARRRASGGPASGLTLVGEQGPEVLNLPGGSFVNNNNTSRQMMNGGNQDNSAAIVAAFEQIANSMRFDYAENARAIRDAIVMTGR
jgi:hypothetical protein